MAHTVLKRLLKTGNQRIGFVKFMRSALEMSVLYRKNALIIFG